MGKENLAARLFATCCIVLAMAGPAAYAGYTTLWNNGPSANRVDMVFLGDGYLSSQLNTTYVTHINNMLNHMFYQGEDPFPRYRNFFNVYKIDTPSNQTGADVPPNTYRDTALGATYYYDGVTDRLLYVNEALAWQALNTNLAGSGFNAEMRMVTVNDTRYGGGGGSFAVYAGGNSSAPEVALHELGHSFSGLADEYVSYSTPYPSTYEPGSPNLTVSSTGQKWSEWLGYVDPAHPSMGPIGAYPGGGYYASGVYRPGNNSKMRSLGQPFDAVSREKIILDMYKYVDPLDTWLSNVARLVDPDKVWVDTVDPNVISLEWFVNGLKVEGAAGEAFDLSDYGYGPGQYAVMARAFDPTPWVRRNRDQLEESITWDILLTPEPATLVVLLAGAWSLARRRSRIV